MTPCDGGYTCPAAEHIEGCYTGEGDPYAVTGLYIGRLREALKPFADLADVIDDLRHEDDSTCIHRLKASDIRRARAALASPRLQPTPEQVDRVPTQSSTQLIRCTGCAASETFEVADREWLYAVTGGKWVCMNCQRTGKS